MGKVLQREGLDTHFSEILYWVVVQEALLFGLVFWATPEAINRSVEVTYISLLRHITYKRARINTDGI